MPPLLLSATESAPHHTGSNPAPIGKPVLRLPPSTYSVHDNHRELIPSDVNENVGVGMTQCIAARRMHNALQPISRLNSDVLEQLFLTAAFLAAHPIPPSSSSSSSSYPSAPSQYSLTRTILTYAHLSSALRDTALRSKRLWALLLDFERAAATWNEELLRRSGGVGLELVWQWSKAGALSGPHSVAHARSLSEASTRRSDMSTEAWAWEDRDVVAKRREERGKRARLEAVLRKEVLGRARSLGFAVPAPYFASLLLERLGAPGGVLPELESLRIVKSRPRRGSVTSMTREEEDEEEDGDGDGEEEGVYVPLEVVANAPRLRRLAIAESNLAFHDLLSFPSTSTLLSPSSAQSTPPNSIIAPSAPLLPVPSPLTLSALRTLSHLQALHIADVPLRTAPTAREWLRYLTFMPGLETLVLEGAVVRRADRGLWDARKAGSTSAGGGTGGNTGFGSANRGTKGMEDEVVEKSALPRLRLLTLDAALEDVAVFAAALPLPSPSRTLGGRRQMKWTLLCADADTGDADDVERVVGLLARAVRGDAQDRPSDGRASASAGEEEEEEEETAGLSLSARATERDVYVHLSASALRVAGGEIPAAPRGDGADADGWDADPEAGFAIYVHLHSTSGGAAAASASAFPQPNRLGVHDIAARPTITSTSTTTLLSPVLAALARGVLPHMSALELELPHVASSGLHAKPLGEVLRGARRVEALTLGPRAAKGVLRMLHGERHNRSRSMESQVSSSSASSSESGSDCESFSASRTTAGAEENGKRLDADTLLLPSLRILHLGAESAAGPAWTALLRFLRARVAHGVPVQRIVFDDKDTDSEDDRPQAHFVRLERARIPDGRIRELEVLGVGVVVNN